MRPQRAGKGWTQQKHTNQFSSVQFSLSVMSKSLQSHESQHARHPCRSPTPGVYSHLTTIESVMRSSHLILCCPLFLLPQIPPSIWVFSNESTLRMRWPKYWSFRFSIIPSKEHSGLISFRMDWLDLLAVQGTLKSLLQHHSSEASILRHSAIFTVQPSHDHWENHSQNAIRVWQILHNKPTKCAVFPTLFHVLTCIALVFLPWNLWVSLR